MDVLGIKFAPLNITLKRRLQTLAAGSWFFTIAFGGLTGLLLALYLILFTRYWLPTLLYVIWAWTIDTKSCNRGGRPIELVRKLPWWTYMKQYFPIELRKQEGVELDPKKNYLLCSFPHGLLCTGAFLSFATDAGGVRKLFPNHTTNLLTLRQHFNMPFFREFIYSLGICNSSAKSINWFLNYPGGGKAPLLVIGGVAEAFYCKPGKYTLVLNSRKGFVKLAMQNGTALVPVFSFGETDIFDQVDNPKGSLLRAIQDWIKKITGITTIIPIGRGFLQYSFGWVPQRRPINTVVGRPFEVERVENPTKEQIDAVHSKFKQHLITFFDEEKHKYVKDPDNTQLNMA